MNAGRDAGLRERVPAKQRWLASPLGGGESERVRLRLRYLLSGYRPEPLSSHRGTVEDPTEVEERIGICCSGGGIRSAAFNLGALQELQRAGVLKRASYLAAVSGGSYIAAAFAMVRKTSTDPDEDDSDPTLFTSEHKPPFDPGSPEEQYLRNRCDYLAPDGLAKLYLLFRVVLGLLFNTFFVVLPFIGLTLLLGALAYRHAFPDLLTPPHGTTTHCTNAYGEFGCETIELPTWSWLAPTALAGLGVLCGLRGLLFRISSDELRRALETWCTRLLVGAALTALLTVLLPELIALFHLWKPGCHTTANDAAKNLTGQARCSPPAPPSGAAPAAAPSTNAAKTAVPLAGGGIAALLAGLAAQLRSAFKEAEEGIGRFRKLSARLQRFFAYLVAAVIGPLLLFAVVVFTMAFALANAWTSSEAEAVLFSGLAVLGGFGLLYFAIDITSLSLHNFYKRRLCSAFALKRVRPTAPRPSQPWWRPPDHSPREAADESEQRDGIAVERDYQQLVNLSDTAQPDQQWPTLLVCACANVSDPGATPPGRHVTSFTFSADSVGGPLIGAVGTQDYETVFGEPSGPPPDAESMAQRRKRKLRAKRQRDLTLPAAVAMSGAAVAPSMGKLTRRPLTFLLALGNVRLGVWVPNPRWVDGSSAVGKWRRPRPSYLIRELMGRNRADGRYLFVTDGGHYENLGLVELLRRGCTKIYCFDASGGTTFDELGDAVALARSELSVSVALDPTPLTPSVAAGSSATSTATDDNSLASENAVEGTFVYPNKVKGRLIYARNVMTETAPWDVRARHREDPSFPHNSTADQLYTDQKFESYRALGALAGNKACKLMPPPDSDASS